MEHNVVVLIEISNADFISDNSSDLIYISSYIKAIAVKTDKDAYCLYMCSDQPVLVNRFHINRLLSNRMYYWLQVAQTSIYIT